MPVPVELGEIAELWQREASGGYENKPIVLYCWAVQVRRVIHCSRYTNQNSVTYHQK